MTWSPGEKVELFAVFENSDKTEGRGATINKWYFTNKMLAIKQAEGLGPMGTNESIHPVHCMVGIDGKLYNDPASSPINDDDIITDEDLVAIGAVRRKLTTHEERVLRKLMRKLDKFL